jgi:hypothetical protein
LTARFKTEPLAEAEEEFYQKFPSDGYLNLDEDAMTFFEGHLDTNNRAVLESIRTDSLSCEALLDSFEQDLFHLIANMMIDLNEELTKYKETNVRLFDLAKNFCGIALIPNQKKANPGIETKSTKVP